MCVCVCVCVCVFVCMCVCVHDKEREREREVCQFCFRLCIMLKKVYVLGTRIYVNSSNSFIAFTMHGTVLWTMLSM